MKKTIMRRVFVMCIVIFLACLLLCVFNLDVFSKKPFQQTTFFSGPAMAKLDKDGNLYVIDSGSFRLVCMAPDGNIRYMINIDRKKEYTRIADIAVDNAGNLYMYAVEAQYDAHLTKRDIIRKYDSRGTFIKDIVSINYDDTDNNPRLFRQFGSLRYEDGSLTFSRIERDRVTLYQYDTFRESLRQSAFTGFMTEHNTADKYLLAQLVVKDMYNFAYTKRDGDIFEVVNGNAPVLCASFNWSEEDGGIIPWYIQYDSAGNIVFFDMASNSLFRLSGERIHRIVPESYFEPLKMRGEKPALRGFGFYDNTFAGVYDSIVWKYDGINFTVYDQEIRFPASEIMRITIVQLSFVLGILFFIAGLYILFVHILDRYVSLFIKQTVIIIPLLVIAFSIMFSMTFNILMDRYNTTVHSNILYKAMLSAQLINGNDIDNIKSIKDFNSESYSNLLQTLKEITRNNADAWNQGYYAALFKGEHFELALMICTEEIGLFTPDQELDEEDYDRLISGQPTGGIFSLEDGNWAFAAAPVYNSAGEISGKVEIGFDMIAFEISNARLKMEITFIAIAICVIILLALAVMVYFVVKQLVSVANVLRAIAAGERTKRVRYKARDELGKVSHGLNSMAEELQNQFDHISRLNESTLRFVPMQFMEHLGVSDITKLKLGDNVQREITVLFFDIRGFSISSEMMTAKNNFMFVNEILGIAGPIFRKHNGFVDKYIGDAAMVLFDNGLDAVRAGVELYRALVLDKNTKVKIDLDGIKIGAGIHTGSVMMGIVGENERLSSTVISANVNLASRIESLSKQTGSGLLISKNTLNQLTGGESEFAYRFIGMVQAAGMNEVVGIFDILDALSARDRRFRLATKTVFESGVRNFHSKDYAAAVKRFEKVVAVDPYDICAAQHLAEAKKHLEDPSLPSVFVFNKK